VITFFILFYPRSSESSESDFLQEEIAARNILKKEVAKSLAILPHHFSGIFAGKRNISARLAVKPEKLFGISFHYWLGLQMEYDLFVAKQLEAQL